MTFRKTTPFALLIILSILGGLAGTTPPAVQAAPLAALPASDIYGYTASTGDLIPLTVCGDSGSIIPFGSDENFSTPLPIGFNFPFYEKTYIYFGASINGVLTFSDTTTLGGVDDHFYMPLDLLPNDLIAPFWTDLGLSTAGKVCYKTSADATRGQFLTVEWSNVELNNIPGAFTFQALLFENGDIQFQYPTAIPNVSSATIGIEDSQGIFGLQAYYNEAGLVPPQVILITPPVSTRPGGRFAPTFSSDFLINREANLHLTLQNISGTLRNFELSVGASAATACNWDALGWEVTLLQGGTPLDNNGNACPDVQIAANSQVELTARIRAPQSAQVGDFKQFRLTALPVADGFSSINMELQAAVPAAFAQAYVSNTDPMTLALTWEKGRTASEAGETFTGRNLALTKTGNGSYFYAWEYYIQGSYLQGTVFSPYGDQIKEPFDLTSSSGTNKDEQLTVGSTPNGNLANAWVRITDVESQIGDLLINIYSPNGTPLFEYIQIILGNILSAPRIAADVNNNFYVLWMQQGADNQNDVYLSIINSTTGIITKTIPVTDVSNTTEDYFSPAITSLISGGAIISYSVNNGSSIQPIAYHMVDANGNLSPIKTITYEGLRARGKDMVQLSSGNVLVSWIDENTRHVHYTFLTEATGWNSIGIGELAPSYQLGAINVSATSDELDHGIITWAEEKGNRTLSYALIDSAGTVLTPPMVFKTGTGLDTNAAGLGNAPYNGWRFLFIPLVVR